MSSSNGPTRRRAWSDRIRLIVGLGVSAVFIALTVRGLDLAAFVEHLQQADYLWLVPGIIAYVLAVWARTWRWQYMLRPIELVPMYPLFKLVCIGYFGNNVFPARAGEVLRSYELRRERGISMSSSLATVVVERTFDGLVMLLFVFVALPLVDIESQALGQYRGFIVGFTLLFVGALAVFLLVAARPLAARRVYVPVLEALLPHGLEESVVGLVDRFLVGFESLRSGRDVVMLFGTSVVVWLFETAKYWFVMHAFPFEVSFFALMLMNGVVNLATTLPAAPGYVGTFDLPGIRVLMAAGVPQAVATAYTVVLHVALWLPITLLGGFYLWQAHVDLRAVYGGAPDQRPDERVGQ